VRGIQSRYKEQGSASGRDYYQNFLPELHLRVSPGICSTPNFVPKL
jgi:hypothetical protein